MRFRLEVEGEEEEGRRAMSCEPVIRAREEEERVTVSRAKTARGGRRRIRSKSDAKVA